MREINEKEKSLVSGAGQYLQLTHMLVGDGLEGSCIENYYNSHQESIYSLSEENLLNQILQQCPPSSGVILDFIPVDVALLSD